MVKKQPGVALGFGVPRSDQTIVTSSGSVGLTEMLPYGAQRIWWPQIVCRPMTEYGMSLQAVLELDRRDRGAEGDAAVGRLHDHQLESNRSFGSQAASFWKFAKWT